MKRSEKKFQTVFYLITALVLFGVIAAYILMTRRTPDTTDENYIPPIGVSNETEVIQTIESDINKSLARKNGWDTGEFDTHITYSDRYYTTLEITSENPDIPKGTVLARQQGEQFTIVFDPTTPDPCSTLTAGQPYPYSVNEICRPDTE